MAVQEQIANAIKNFREVEGVCLNDLALRSSLTSERLSEIESGARWPTDSELDLILIALDLTLFELICSSKIGKSLTRKLLRITKEKISIIEAAVDGLLRSQN